MQLPDGSTVNARTPAIAAAVKSYLAGTPLDAAYRQAGIELPPPGTPVTSPADPAALTAGAIGMFKDHYVVALSAAKALQDGAGGAAVRGGGRAGLPRLDRPVGAQRAGRDPAAGTGDNRMTRAAALHTARTIALIPR